MNAPNQPRHLADHAVTPVRPGDPRLIACGYSETAVGFEQTEGGPTFLVIGHQAPEDAIDRGCLRFNLDRLQVMAALASDRRQECAR